jgi:hypothetical protein
VLRAFSVVWAVASPRRMLQWVGLHLRSQAWPSWLSSGFTTCMKTVEITRVKQAASGAAPLSSWATFMDIYRREGIRGINKGVNAVAVRQCTNWGSRYVTPSRE